MIVAAIQEEYLNLLAYQLHMKQYKARVYLSILFQLKIASVKLKILCSCVLLINSIFLLQNLFEILKYFSKFGLLRVISLFSLSDDQSIENRVEKFSIEVDEQFIDFALDDYFTCILGVSLLLALDQHLNIGPYDVFVRVLEVVMRVGEDKVVLLSLLVDQREVD